MPDKFDEIAGRLMDHMHAFDISSLDEAVDVPGPEAVRRRQEAIADFLRREFGGG